MSFAKWIFCESQGKWAVACRRALVGIPTSHEILLIETRSLTDCRDELRRSPGAFVTLELTPVGCDEALQWMMELPRWRPDVAFAVAADRTWQNYEPLVRELGAVSFVVSPRRVLPLAEMAARHLAQWSESEQTPAERTLWRGSPGTSNVGLDQDSRDWIPTRSRIETLGFVHPQTSNPQISPKGRLP